MEGINKAETTFLYQDIIVQGSYKKVLETLPPNPIILDIGANIGMFAHYMDKATDGESQLYCFEPIPAIFECLKKNAATFKGKINLYDFGISELPKTVPFFYSKNYSLLSSYTNLYETEKENCLAVALYLLEILGVEAIQDEELKGQLKAAPKTKHSIIVKNYYKALFLYSETTDVQLQKLSDWLKKHPLDHIDLLKIDAEMSELAILKGIDKHDWQLIDKVVAEVHLIGENKKLFTQEIEKHGFKWEILSKATPLKFFSYLIFGAKSLTIPISEQITKFSVTTIFAWK